MEVGIWPKKRRQLLRKRNDSKQYTREVFAMSYDEYDDEDE
jgi:hypothetical protein